jgi:hypothetical protein
MIPTFSEHGGFFFDRRLAQCLMASLFKSNDCSVILVHVGAGG